MDAISRVWYNGSYTIAAKPIKTLELHYTMIQLLIIQIIKDYFIRYYLYIALSRQKVLLCNVKTVLYW